MAVLIMEENVLKITNECNDAIQLLSSIHKADINFFLFDQTQLVIDLGEYSNAKPLVLVVLSSYIDRVLRLNLNYRVRLIPPENSDVKNYMARMKFFEVNQFNEIEYPYREYDPSGRFIELKSFNESSQHSVNQELTEIIKRIKCPEDFKMLLSYCFSELTDNTCCHAETTNKGFISGQTYASTIHISIADSGIGIAESMRKAEGYSTLSDCDLLAKSIQENVSSKLHDTTRDHQGMGLFALSEFIRKSAGELHIFSNGAHLYVHGNNTIIQEGPYWQGTFIDFKYPINYNVTLWAQIVNDFFVQRGYTVPDHFLETDGNLF